MCFPSGEVLSIYHDHYLIVNIQVAQYASTHTIFALWKIRGDFFCDKWEVLSRQVDPELKLLKGGCKIHKNPGLEFKNNNFRRQIKNELMLPDYWSAPQLLEALGPLL